MSADLNHRDSLFVRKEFTTFKISFHFPVERLYFVLNHYLLLIRDHVCGVRFIMGISF
jgi:hypothetical protein